MSPLLAAVALGVGVLLAVPGSRASFEPPRWLTPLLAWGVLAALAGTTLSLGNGLLLPLAGIVGVGVWAGYRQLQSKRARAQAERRAVDVIDTCEGLVADLHAGQPPLTALQAAAGHWSEFRPVADAGRLGGDVAEALRQLALSPGARGLNSVAAAWVIAHRSGAGLADAVDLAAQAIREERSIARVVDIEMSSARATARLLAALPLGVLLIGRGTGGDPFGFLVGTTAGLICLGCGLSLSWAGLAWLERIARSVQG